MSFITILGRYKSILLTNVALISHIGVFNNQVEAQHKEQIGYNRLLSELNASGQSLPTGAGIRVGIVEAPNAGNHFPNTSGAEFIGKSIVPVPAGSAGVGNSSHATTVLRNFVGNTSGLVPGVTEVDVYEANNFGNNVLNTPGNPPNLNLRVLNHSYVGTANAPGGLGSIYMNSRMDYVINRDQITNVVGLSNESPLYSAELYANSFNSISVGLTNGAHADWVTNGSFPGRTKPDIVAPSTHTSFAAPIVASAATLLHAVADDQGLTNATRPEAMKAILMAGADKNAFGNDYTWSNTSTGPLDATYGAGELDVYNSYKILTAGEQNGSFAFDVAPDALIGWDAGSIGSGQELFWNFEIGSGMTATEASFLLTWNAQMSDASNNFDLTKFALADMRLSLYATNDLNAALWVSDSSVDNVEHIYLRDLAAGNYTFGVFSDIDSDFAIAWNVSAVPEPTSLALLTSLAGACAIRFVGRRRRSSKGRTGFDRSQDFFLTDRLS